MNMRKNFWLTKRIKVYIPSRTYISSPNTYNKLDGCNESHHGYKSNLFFNALEAKVVWSQYGLQKKARYKCVRSDSMSENNEKVELHRYWEKLEFSLSFTLAHKMPFIAVTHISREYSRGKMGDVRWKKRKIYVRNKCVNMSDTTFSLCVFISYRTCCNFHLKWYVDKREM